MVFVEELIQVWSLMGNDAITLGKGRGTGVPKDRETFTLKCQAFRTAYYSWIIRHLTLKTPRSLDRRDPFTHQHHGHIEEDPGHEQHRMTARDVTIRMYGNAA